MSIRPSCATPRPGPAPRPVLRLRVGLIVSAPPSLGVRVGRLARQRLVRRPPQGHRQSSRSMVARPRRSDRRLSGKHRTPCLLRSEAKGARRGQRRRGADQASTVPPGDLTGSQRTRPLQRVLVVWLLVGGGGWAFTTAIGVYAFHRAGAGGVGAIAAARLLPAVVGAPLSGHTLDRVIGCWSSGPRVPHRRSRSPRVGC